MGSTESSQYIERYPGMSLPTDNRLPWNPWCAEPFQDNRNNVNRLPWNPWCAEPFQDNRNNVNGLTWNPWFAEPFQDNSNNGYRLPRNPWSEDAFQDNSNNGYRLPRNPWSEEAFEETGNNENKLPWNPWCTEAFQDSKNSENLQLRNPWLTETFREDRNKENWHYFSSKNNRKNRKRNRSRKVLRQTINNNAAISSQEMRQHGQQGWNHEPVMDWTKINLPPRPIKNNFQYLSRLNSSNEHYETSHGSRTFTRNKFINTSPNYSSSTLEASKSRTNFKSRNLSKTDTRNSKRNAENHPDSRKLSCRDNNMDKKGKKKVNSTFSNNSENCNEEDDIEYMFSVDPSPEGQLVLEVDLQSDVLDFISNKNSSETINVAETSQVEDATAEQPIITSGKSETTVSSKSRKRKLFDNDTVANKKPNYQPICTGCGISYDGITEKNENMYMSSSCRHIFCGSCIAKDGKLSVCPVCKDKFLNFRRLYV